jgi:hypothetical protein
VSDTPQGTREYSERRWVNEICQVAELFTGDESGEGPAVIFGLQIKQNPMERRHLEMIRDTISHALETIPENRILRPGIKIQIPR